MITIPTVLVLGAGASTCFGYPSGQKLKQNILANYNQYDLLISQLGYTDKNTQEFIDALRTSGRSSVDAFLEHRPDFVEIGKIEITLDLITHEKFNLLYEAENNWYEYLFQQMDCEFTDFPKNKITFITFNYDRTLEFYLFNALINSYGKKEAEVAEIINQTPIIHVHGKLGNLPWQDPNGRPYSDRVIYNFLKRSAGYERILSDIKDAAQGIKIISEIADVETNFAPVVSPLLDAKRIIFLGFGYNSVNLDRLFFKFKHSESQYPTIFGTCLGLTELEQRKVYDDIAKRTEIGVKLIATDILSFFRGTVNPSDNS
jgi:hypothetical protein